MAVKLAFNRVEQFANGVGVPYSGAKLFTYVAGSVNTKLTTYTESTGTTPNTNPIVLDSSGNLPQPIWLTTGSSYKFVLAPSTDTDPPTSPIWSLDNITGINDASISISEWNAGPTPTFVSATQFTLVGDQTSTFAKSRRVKATVTAGTVYGTITASAFGALTTVTLALDSGNLDSGLSAVSYGIVAPVNPSISPDEIYRKGTAVASAATTDIWSIAGDYVHVTGTVAITSLGTAPYAGDERTVIFDGALQITHNATTLQCPSGLDIWTAAGDRATVRADTTANMVITSFSRADGQAVSFLPRSIVNNPFFSVFQRQTSGTAADDTYVWDRWYVLTQTNPITPTQGALQENGQATNARLSQSNAVAQRMGVAQILEAAESQPFRGKVMTFRPRVRISSSQAIRIAILEWTGTADSVTSDVVLDWTSGTFTAGNFFLAASLTVTGVGAKTPSANTWTDMDPLTVTIGSSCNNLVLFAWTEATAAQNVTFDIGKVRFVQGTQATEIYIPTFEEVLRHGQRFFEKTFPYATAPAQNTGNRMGSLSSGVSSGTTGAFSHWIFRTEKRASPTIVTYNPQAADSNWRRSDNAASLTVAIDGTTSAGAHINSGVAGGSGFFYYIHASAEIEL